MSFNADLLTTVNELLTEFISGNRVDKQLFDRLLSALLKFTDSEYGFIGHIENHEGVPRLRTNAITNISWDETSKASYEKTKKGGMVFDNLNTLFGAVIKNQSLLIANNAAQDPRRGGLPSGHPSMQSFCGIPIFYRGEMISMAGIANRKDGYTPLLIESISPLLNACAVIYQGLADHERQAELSKAKDDLLEQEKQIIKTLSSKQQELKRNLEHQEQLSALVQSSERKFRAMIENAYDGLVLYDEKGRVIFGSTSAERISGHKLSDHVGKDGGFFIFPEDRAEASRHFKQLLKEPGNTIQFQQRIIHAEGHVLWIEVSLTNLLFHADVGAVVSNFRDISDRKRAVFKLIKSEQLYRSLFEFNPTALWIYDTINYQFLDVNDAALRMYGYSKEELLGMDIFQVRPKDQHPILRQRLEHVKDTHGMFPAAIHLKKSGEIMVVDAYYSAIDYEDKEAFLVQLIDNTKRYKGEDRIKELLLELKNFKNAVDQTMLVALLDKDGRFIHVNHAIEEVTGNSDSDFIGKTFYDLKSPFHNRAYYQSMLKAIKSDEVWRGEYHGLNIDKQEYWLDVLLSPVMDDHGQVKQYIALCLLINERKKAEQERDLLIDDLTRKNQSLEEFAFVTSHNLRAPVARIIGLVHLFGDAKLNQEEKTQIVEMMGKAAENLDQVIRDLTEILAVKKDVKDNKSTFSLKEVLDNVLLNFQDEITQTGVEVSIDLKGTDKLFSVKSYLYSVLLNLISNAIKYRDEQKPVTYLQITSKSERNMLAITIRDNGLGIDLETQGHKVFGLYKRFHSHVEGRGLGLYLVKNQVEAMGGSISIESKPREGSSFCIRIPKML